MEINSLSRASLAPVSERSNSATDRTLSRAVVSPEADLNSTLVRNDAVAQTSAAQEAGSKSKEAAAKESSEKPSEAKSLVYGALGLAHPEEEEKYNDAYYTAGKMITGALTVGSIISVLV